MRRLDGTLHHEQQQKDINVFFRVFIGDIHQSQVNGCAIELGALTHAKACVRIAQPSIRRHSIHKRSISLYPCLVLFKSAASFSSSHYTAPSYPPNKELENSFFFINEGLYNSIKISIIDILIQLSKI